jgi:hypothetical protein
MVLCQSAARSVNASGSPRALSLAQIRDAGGTAVGNVDCESGNGHYLAPINGERDDVSGEKP